MQKKFSILVLAIFIIGLYVLQNKAITPFVMKVISSDLFLEDDDSNQPKGTASQDRTRIAFLHCVDHIRESIDPDLSPTFNEIDYKAWHLGGNVYLINSSVEFLNQEHTPPQKFTCKMKFTGDDANNYDNWDFLASNLQ